jgi:hypothetical protein
MGKEPPEAIVERETRELLSGIFRSEHQIGTRFENEASRFAGRWSCLGWKGSEDGPDEGGWV